MRKELKKIEGQRNRFQALFVRYGTKAPFKGWVPVTTLLFKDVKDTNDNIVADHIWFTTTKGFEKFSFKENDIVRFDARVNAYEKGYKGFRIEVYNPVSKDFKLSHPTKIQLVKINETGQLSPQ